MKQLPKSLLQKLQQREENNSLRTLPVSNKLIDFASNDYLGFAQNETIFNNAHQYLIDNNIKINGATGSRLISGNHNLYTIAEDYIAAFHQSESALIFNSGYDANVGFFSSVPQRNDIILYDELCHASIRDGIQLSNAKSYKFQHNDCEDLEAIIKNLELKIKNSNNFPISKESNFQLPTSHFQLPTFFIVTESVFSMDGDSPNIEQLVQLCEKYNAYLVVDEAHSLGVFAENGEGLIQNVELQDKIFARIMTFGKGLGCHGAAILGSNDLKKYLVNFARSFIYTTGLSPHSVATILTAYQYLATNKTAINQLNSNIQFFNQSKLQLGLKPLFVYSKSAIQSAIIPGNVKVKTIASQLQENGFDIKAILSPTVPEGQERLRFCIHYYNSEEEITQVLLLLQSFLTV